MSQQQASFHESEADRPDATYSGYTGAPPYQQSYGTPIYGQKLTIDSGHKPSPGQRLALAIVSLSLLMVAFIIAIAAASSMIGLLQLVGIIGLIIFTVAIIIVNALFNSSR